MNRFAAPALNFGLRRDHCVRTRYLNRAPVACRFVSPATNSSRRDEPSAPAKGIGGALQPSAATVWRLNSIRFVSSTLGSSTSPTTSAPGAPAASEQPIAHDLPVINPIGDAAHEVLGFMRVPDDKLPKPGDKGLPCATADSTPKGSGATTNASESEEVERIKRSMPADLDKKEVWRKIKAANTDKLRQELSDAQTIHEVEWSRLEKEMKDEDRFHWRLAQITVDTEPLRRDVLALHYLAMKLNKARWNAIEIQSQPGTGKTGAGMRLTFWRESCFDVIDKREVPKGQFTDSHPVLRPFADVVRRHHPTRAFLRGTVDARLKIIPQPANIQQLFDHFDKFYGYFYVSLLEILGVKQEDIAEHIAMHLGRAQGLIQHCVLLWREYARKGMTLLPADICADNHVNLSLLKNIPLAQNDKCVRRVLYTVCGHAKAELDHVRELIPACPTVAWPILMEAFFANYYIRFLEKHNFDVTKWYSDQFQYSMGFYWFSIKKLYHWGRTKDLAVLVSEEAPNPLLFWKSAKTFKEMDEEQQQGTTKSRNDVGAAKKSTSA